MTLEAYVQGFGCMGDPRGYREARLVLLPAPLDWGTEEAMGAAMGPLAILGASRFIETFEPEVEVDVLDLGLATLDGPELSYDAEERPLEQIQAEVSRILGDGKFALVLGGERSVAIPAARAAAEARGRVATVCLSGRLGFEETWHGRRYTGATLGRRLSEVAPTLFLGARFWPAGDNESRLGPANLGLISARTIHQDATALDAALAELPPEVHLSVDVNVLDPAYLPVPQNLEPGGLSWFEATSVIDRVFAERKVVSCDVSGFVPAVGNVAPSLVAAQLVLRCLARAGEQLAR